MPLIFVGLACIGVGLVQEVIRGMRAQRRYHAVDLEARESIKRWLGS